MPDKICHIEIIAKDQVAAAKFYSELFDWETSTEFNYTQFKDGGVGGGFMSPIEEAQCGTCIYIEVDDIDEKLKAIEAAGGKVVKPKTKISDEYGYYALFSDPHGNVIGLWSKN